MPTAESVTEGVFRVQGTAGYAVYVGENVLPNLDNEPTSFVTSLPTNIAITPPGVDTKTVNVIVRRRDIYGLESQNQQPASFIIDTAGDLQYPTLLPPQDLQLRLRPDGKLKIVARYSGFGIDEFPATKWRLWTGLTPPDPDVDTPTEVAISPALNYITLTALPPGLTTYVAVALYRALDTSQSEEVTGEVDVPVDPDTPEAVW